MFKGIAEFAQQPPLIITGDNYDQTGAAVDEQSMGFAHDVRVNIFNISKINSEVRGGKEPRIKRMREVLGDSYFNHLANLPDLVLLMDESHRYRDSAGVRSINELKPLFGLEVTATPFVESSRGPVPFKNVVMDYPLARAMEDGFVKEPAVVTQRNFDAKAHTPEEVEKVKLEDGVRLHETTKVELLTYARENVVKPVKPFMLVIARDTTHAGQFLALLESEAFYEGHYQGKVIQVDSSRIGKEEEEMSTRFQIYYKLGTEQPEYIPDFVAETDATIFMVETKARADINTQEVQAKAAAAMRWCKHASDHAASVGTKPWKYLLVPHDEINESKRLVDYLRFEVKASLSRT